MISKLIRVGVFLAAVSLLIVGYSLLNRTAKPVTSTYTFQEPFDKIEANCVECDVEFLTSNDGTCQVICQESNKGKHEVKIENGTLKILRESNDHLSINLQDLVLKVTVYLPRTYYKSLNVTTSSGDIHLPVEIMVDHVVAQSSSGDIDVRGDFGQSLDVKTSSGNVNVKNAYIRGSLIINTSSGDVNFDRSDAAEMSVQTSSGDVKGNLLSGKHFFTRSSSGDIRVPASFGEAPCDIRTSSGDISLSVK